MPIRGLGLVTFIAFGLCASACSSSSEPTSDGAGATPGSSGSGNAGGSTGSGASTGSGGNTYVPPTCDQGCQDYLVAWALTDTVWFLWNQNLAGHPVGPQDVMSACPLGGSVHISGFDDVSDNGITTAEMLFDLDNCEKSNTTYTLSFTGAVMMDGSFDSATDYAAITFSTTSLDTVGSLDWLDDPEIDEGCVANVTQTGFGDAFALNGRLCGRDFDERSLETAGSGGSGQGGSSSSGGSSSGGSGSNTCMCFCPDGSDCTNASEPNPCGVDADGIPNVCGCPVNCP